MSISHEKLFEAWPALKEYVETHKKALVDRTLLESRAQKWDNMDKPWFSGLATGREYQDFRRADMSANPLTEEYLSASVRGQWLLAAGIVFPILGITALVTWLVQAEKGCPNGLAPIMTLCFGSTSGKRI